MTTGDAGRCFWGPDGIWSRTTDYFVKAAAGCRALVVRQAAAIRRLRGLLAEQRAAAAAPMVIAADPIAPFAPGQGAPEIAAEPIAPGVPGAPPPPPPPSSAAAVAAGPPPANARAGPPLPAPAALPLDEESIASSAPAPKIAVAAAMARRAVAKAAAKVAARAAANAAQLEEAV